MYGVRSERRAVCACGVARARARSLWASSMVSPNSELFFLLLLSTRLHDSSAQRARAQAASGAAGGARPRPRRALGGDEGVRDRPNCVRPPSPHSRATRSQIARGAVPLGPIRRARPPCGPPTAPRPDCTTCARAQTPHRAGWTGCRSVRRDPPSSPLSRAQVPREGTLAFSRGSLVPSASPNDARSAAPAGPSLLHSLLPLQQLSSHTAPLLSASLRWLWCLLCGGCHPRRDPPTFNPQPAPGSGPTLWPGHACGSR